ncbi:MAG: hypothetical protein KA150_06705 [Propionivibrio sp.]|jgi:hypothetical protein|nr:hypothetical protein [Propionivibrio sp.]
MKRVLYVAALVGCAVVWAGPAAWYKWHSAESAIDICSQTSPGDGWVPVKGPFSDALCRKQGVPR